MWEWVSRELEPTTQVCAYDRAGWGWSESGPLPRDTERVVAELHELVEAAGIERPFIYVGHSVGGLFGLGYAERHPEQLAALVLVDSRHPQRSNARRTPTRTARRWSPG